MASIGCPWGCGLDPPTGSDRARGSLHCIFCFVLPFISKIDLMLKWNLLLFVILFYFIFFLHWFFLRLISCDINDDNMFEIH